MAVTDGADRSEPPVRLTVALQRPDVELIGEWDRLARDSGARAFARPGWILTWADAFAAGSLRCLTARAGRELVGLVPVVAAGRSVLRSATNSETPRFDPLVTAPWVLEAMTRQLPDGYRRLSLGYVSAEDPIRSALREGPALDSRLLERVIRESPYLRTEGDYETFEQDRLSVKRRQNLRRLERRLGELGRLEFKVVDPLDDLDRLDTLLDEGLELEAAGWKGDAGTAVKSRPDALSFYRSATRWAAEERMLTMYFLRLDGRPVAFSVGLRDGPVVTGLKLAFDERLRSHAPGVILQKRRLQSCFSAPGVTRFEFAGEAEKYKLEWTDTTEEQIQLELFAPGRAPAVEARALRAAWRARAELRQRVPLEVRERIDTTSPTAAIRTTSALAVGRLRRRGAASGP